MATNWAKAFPSKEAAQICAKELKNNWDSIRVHGHPIELLTEMVIAPDIENHSRYILYFQFKKLPQRGKNAR